jgi:hypothetical protein
VMASSCRLPNPGDLSRVVRMMTLRPLFGVTGDQNGSIIELFVSLRQSGPLGDLFYISGSKFSMASFRTLQCPDCH